MPAIPLSKTLLYHSAPCGYYSINKKGVITDMNKTALHWLGYSLKELKGRKTFCDLLAEANKEIASASLAIKDKPVPLELIKKDGNTLPVLHYRMGTCSVLINIAERQRLKEQLVKANEQLYTLEQEKEFLTGIASHDMQNTLSVIVHLSETLLHKDTGPLSAYQQKIAGLINTASREMMATIKKYLAMGRLEAGMITIEMAPADITRITLDIVNRYREIAGKKSINLNFTASRELVLLTDDNYYSQIIENLLSNAIKYSHPGKNVYVSMYEGDNGVCIEVKDEGVGIPKKELPLIFKKFQNLSSKPTAGELSTGLGLNITKFLVNQLKGTINVKSKWGKGTCFKLKFCKGDQGHQLASSTLSR